MSPELFDLEGRNHHPTKFSDCYALGMATWEVLSGHLPFHQYKKWAISAKVLRGDRPERPQGEEGVWFTDEVWEILGSCWMTQPEGRPSIEDVLQCLGEASRSWRPPSPQLPMVLSRADPPTQELSDIITVECTDASNTPPSSQPLERLDQEEPIPVWKRLIDCPLGMNERIPLIADIFSNRDETEAVNCLSGHDAQSFVDVVDEVLTFLSPQKSPLT